MTYRQAGILTSKAMGVYCGVAFIHTAAVLPSYFQTFRGSMSGVGMWPVGGVIVATGCLLYLSLTLWFASGRFVPEEPSPGSGPMRLDDLQRLAFRMLGLYLVISALVPILSQTFFYLLLRPKDGSHSVQTTGFIEDLLYGAMGLSLYFMSFRGITNRTGTFMRRYFGWFASPFESSEAPAEAPGPDEG